MYTIPLGWLLYQVVLSNADKARVVSVGGNVTLLRSVLLQAVAPMLTTESGIFTFSDVQLLNASWPICFTLGGKVRDVSLLQSLNALLPMVVTGGILMDVRFEQYENASDPMVFKVFGRVTAVSPVHPENAFAPMSVMVLGRLMPVSPVQFLKTLNPMPRNRIRNPFVADRGGYGDVAGIRCGVFYNCNRIWCIRSVFDIIALEHNLPTCNR